MERIEYIDGDEFEETVLCQDRHDDLVTGFSVIIEKGETASVGLDEYFGGIVEGAAGMLLEHRRGGHTEALLDIWQGIERCPPDEIGGRHTSQ